MISGAGVLSGVMNRRLAAPGPREARIPTLVTALLCVASTLAPVPAQGDGDAGTFERLRFDGLPIYCLFGDTVALRDEYVDRGVRFRGPGPQDGGGVLGTCSFFLVTGISPPSFLAFNATASYSDGGVPRDPQTILFEPPVSFVQGNVGSFIEVDYPATMTAYDQGGTVVGETTVLLSPVASPLLVSAPGISRVEVTAPGARYVLDDLLFGESPGGDITPLPSTLSVSLQPGATATRTLTLHNAAGHDIDFFVRELSEPVGSALGPVGYVEGDEVPLDNLTADRADTSLVRHQATESPTEPRILVYTEGEPLATVPETDLDQALRSLGFPYTAYYNSISTGFIPALQQDWDLVIFDHQAVFLSDWDLAVYDALLTRVAGGGRLVMTTWQIADRPDHPLWTALGFRWLEDYTRPCPVAWTEAEPAFFSVPDDVPEFSELGDYYAIDGHRIETLPGVSVLAALETSDPALSGEAAMVLSNGGRTLYRAFVDGNNVCDCDLDDRFDTVELWRDVVIQMLADDVPWVGAPDEGTVPANGQLDLELHLDASILEPGTYRAALELRTNEAVFSTYVVDLELEVDGAVLFADDFETADLSAWSGVSPP